MKTCTKCNTTKPATDFHRFAASRDGRRAQCKACSLARLRSNNPARGPITFTAVCGYCSETFTYVHKSGNHRKYCTEQCRYQGGEALRRSRAVTSTRACACGSTDVARVGKPVCPRCKTYRGDPEKARLKERIRTLRRYGLTPETYEELRAAQEDRCAICRTDTPGGRGELWHVDHDHATGAVRGLLCHMCNVGIGNLRDDPAILRRAADYLIAARTLPIAS
ncbi:MAG: endonuclease VII domain-containing protein [Candidatus Nanopelagicales bacterium]|uniref:endonuclease VII domain-containing protein n=1 Tax=Pseudonocardia sp. TaxID=60912 RepID=UPI003D1274C5